MFKIILIFILLMAFVPPFRRFLFWLVVGRQLANQQKKYQNTTEAEKRREGEIRVDKNANSSNDKGKDGGQYIDYEEVK
jgi:hypothetical protein